MTGRPFWVNITSLAGWDNVGDAPAVLNRNSMDLLKKSFKILGTCIKEAPEFASRKRHKKTKNEKDKD